MSKKERKRKLEKQIATITMLLCLLLILTGCIQRAGKGFQTVGKLQEEIDQIMLSFLEEKYEEKFVIAHSTLKGMVTVRYFEFLCYPEGKIEDNFRAYLNDYDDGEPVAMKDEYFGRLIKAEYEAYMVKVMEELGFEEPKAIMSSTNNIYSNSYDKTKGFQDILNDDDEIHMRCLVYLKQEIPDLKELENMVTKIPNILAGDGLKWGGGGIRFVTEEYYYSDLENTTLREMWDNMYVGISIALKSNSVSVVRITDYRGEEKKETEIKVKTGGKKFEINE